MAHRDDVVIGTKFGWPTIDRPNHRGSGRKNLMKALDASLKRLQTDYIDLYQIHHYDPLTPIDEVSWSLEEAVRSGKVRYIGVSNMPAYKFAQMIMLADWRGRSRPIAMQNLYNLIQREQERDVNRLCAEEGIGLIPYSPLARGFLSGTRAREGGGTTERSRNDTVVKAGTYRDCDWEIIERLKRIATARGTTPAQIALAWLLSKSYMAAPIVGATSLEQLESSAKATEIALGSDEIRQLEEPYQFRVQTPE
jgi:aryl-alcohol dehydrogenase (NADP+)